MKSKIPRNAMCPCESGKKYKVCCMKKDFEWVVDENGTVKRIIRLDEHTVDLLKLQRQNFIETFGREPGPDDPIFFEQYSFSDEEYEDFVIQALQKVGVNPAYIHAYKKTQRLVTEGNISKLTHKYLRKETGKEDRLFLLA